MTPVRPWVAPIARTGYTAKGIVYLLIGGMAVRAALGQGGQVSGSEGAIRTIGEQPFGKFLLIGAALGLASHAVWRLLQTLLNLEQEFGAKGFFKRIGYLCSALAYGGLAAFALHLAGGPGSSRERLGSLVAQALRTPPGQVVVGAIGVVLIGVGIFQLYTGVSGRLPERLEDSLVARIWGVRVGRLGVAARAIIFAIIGYHLVEAAIVSRPGESKDMGAVLREIAAQSNGRLWLAAVASGLAAYGMYMLVCARYARIAGGSRR